MSEQEVLHASWLGRTGYVEAQRLQEATASRVLAGSAPHLLLLEHDPVYLVGRRGRVENLPDRPEALAAKGAKVYSVDDDIAVAYHGPGQLIGYPVIHLEDDVGPEEYVHAIEEGLIETILQFGIGARSVEGKNGVWVVMPDWSSVQLASIQPRMARGVSMLSFAINVAVDIESLGSTIPHPVTSFHTIGVPAPIKAVAESCGEKIAEALGGVAQACTLEPVREDEIPGDASVRLARQLTID
jgi:lipoyl(octanoyl) transferase